MWFGPTLAECWVRASDMVMKAAQACRDTCSIARGDPCDIEIDMSHRTLNQVRSDTARRETDASSSEVCGVIRTGVRDATHTGVRDARSMRLSHTELRDNPSTQGQPNKPMNLSTKSNTAP